MPSWTKEEDEKLFRLAGLNHGFTYIASQLPGRTRNSCIGRYNRLKILGAEGAGMLFTDRESLRMLRLVETERLTFARTAKRLRRSSEAVEKHYRDIMRELKESEERPDVPKLGEVQERLMNVMRRRQTEWLTTTDLADRIGRGHSSVRHALSSLEKLGLIVSKVGTPERKTIKLWRIVPEDGS